MKQLLKNSDTKIGRLTEWKVEAFVLVCGFVVMNLIFFAKAFRASGTVDTARASQLGDFVGGYVGTFFVLISIVLLVKTLREQQRSSQLISFETKYFELIRLHRENVKELEVQGVTSRKLFVVLIREFRSILEVARKFSSNSSLNLSQRQLMHIAYYCLFFGTGPNSSRMLCQSLPDFNSDLIKVLEQELNNEDAKNTARTQKKLAYVPFEGHQSRLGHYYRHLYQAVKYVHQQKIKIDKYEYVKTLRAQLSNHEQALLLLNSLTPIGRSWWDNDFIQCYKMVKNIPKDFFDPEIEIDISPLFAPGYFEWDERASV